MAKFLKCPECGGQVSSKAKSCPHCGIKLKKGGCLPVVLGLLVFFLVIGMFSGGEDEQTPVTENPTVAPTAAATNQEVVQATEPQAPAVETTAAAPQVDETVLLEQDGVRLILSGISNEWSGTSFKLRLENDTTQNIAISADDFVVNGVLTMNGSFYIDAAAGKKAIGELKFYTGETEQNDVTSVASVRSLDACVYDTDSYKTIFESDFVIETDQASTYEQPVDMSGEVIYPGEDFVVVGRYITNNGSSQELSILILNNSGQDVVVQADNVSINGYTVSALHSDYIADNTARFSELTFYKSTLEENGIENVTDVSFTLNFLNPDTFSTILETNELTVSASE